MSMIILGKPGNVPAFAGLAKDKAVNVVIARKVVAESNLGFIGSNLLVRFLSDIDFLR